MRIGEKFHKKIESGRVKMERKIGTVSRGIRCPIIRKGDDLAAIVSHSVIDASQSEGFSLCDRDVIGVTESIVARSQGNYASIDVIATDIRQKLGKESIGVIFPILSRNRFAICLRGIAKGVKKVVLMFSYPDDEVGNALISIDRLGEAGINPSLHVLTLDEYRKLFGDNKHLFTGVDYVEYYADIIREAGAEAEILFSNNPATILDYTKNVLTCDIHSRNRTKKILKEAGALKVIGLDDLLTHSIDGNGFNSKYGLLGSNKSTEDTIKLFPQGGADFVNEVQRIIFEKTGKNVEVMIYGDGAFKDPIGKIWELADPCVSPAYTPGLEGTPNELKLKYLADDEFKNLSGDMLKEAIKEKIGKKSEDLTGDMSSQGTTPRKITDLIGSLCDLTSGSGDKGTPIVLVQGYFDNYAN